MRTSIIFSKIENFLFDFSLYKHIKKRCYIQSERNTNIDTTKHNQHYGYTISIDATGYCPDTIPLR